jgi:hypothetical protein
MYLLKFHLNKYCIFVHSQFSGHVRVSDLETESRRNLDSDLDFSVSDFENLQIIAFALHKQTTQ